MGKRIEYIDSLRGFTMLLVVFSHVIVFGYHGLTGFSLNDIFVLFRMPLFFFISGFILYKPTNLTDLNLLNFFKKKFMVQIIPTLFFFLLYCFLFNLNINEGLFSSSKNGYWFTITLFEFFIFYILILKIKRAFRFFRLHDTFVYFTSIIFVFVFLLIYFRGWIKVERIDVLVGFIYLKYFPYFILGILLRKNFVKFEQIIDNSPVTSFLIFIFVFTAIFTLKFALPSIVEFFISYISGVTGLIIVFLFFRKYQAYVSSKSRLGRLFQYIGRRTLDIYLLHYFFLPRNLSFIGDFFSSTSNFILEFFITFIISVCIVLISLIISNILRLSPLYEHYLFGAKKK